MAHVRGRDDGFTLIEVVVAMAVSVVLLSSSLAVVVKASQAAAENDARVAAAGLASSWVETARTQPIATILAAPPVSYRTVGRRTYTVTHTATYVSDTGIVTAVCGSTPTVATAVLITATVTWPSKAPNTPPVRADTVRTAGTTGAVAVSVTGASGQPQPGITVLLDTGTTTTGTAGSGVTDSTGCAVFVGLDAGAYSVTLNTPGYIGIDGSQAFTTPVRVAALEVTKPAVSYDVGVKIRVRYTTANGGTTVSAPAASDLPASLRSGGAVNASGVEKDGAIPGDLGPLWPSAYSLTSGPGDTCVLGGKDLSSGTPAVGNVDVPTAQITVTGASTAFAAGDITATAKGGGACPAGTTVLIGPAVLFLNGDQTVTLPLGTWQVKLPTSLLPLTPLISTLLGGAGLGGLSYFCATPQVLSSGSLAASVVSIVNVLTAFLANVPQFLATGGCT